MQILFVRKGMWKRESYEDGRDEDGIGEVKWAFLQNINFGIDC